MNQSDFIDKFNRDLDKVLAGGRPSSGDQIQTPYDEMLNLAAVLADAKLSPGNSKKQLLRRKLLNLCHENYTAKSKKEVTIMNTFRKHRPAILAASFAVAALVGFNIIFPGTFTAMAKDIGTVLKIGPYVTLIKEDSTMASDPSSSSTLTPEQKTELDKNGYVQYTDKDGSMVTIGTWGKPTVDTDNYTNLSDAQQGVSYKLLSPSYLPEGYSFKNAECYKGSKEYITLNFQGPGKDIILMQRLMNENTKYETGGKLEPVTVNGNTGAWVDSELVWDKDGVNYTLIAKSLSKDEMKKIAESM